MADGNSERKVPADADNQVASRASTMSLSAFPFSAPMVALASSVIILPVEVFTQSKNCIDLSVDIVHGFALLNVERDRFALNPQL